MISLSLFFSVFLYTRIYSFQITKQINSISFRSYHEIVNIGITRNIRLAASTSGNNIEVEYNRKRKRHKVINFIKNIFNRRIFRNKDKPLGKLILVRSGESRWNQEGKFTGWTDVGLTLNGTRDLEFTGNLLREYGYKVDVAYCSQMKRAIESVTILFRELKQVYRPVIKSYKLNGMLFISECDCHLH